MMLLPSRRGPALERCVVGVACQQSTCTDSDCHAPRHQRMPVSYCCTMDVGGIGQGRSRHDATRHRVASAASAQEAQREAALTDEQLMQIFKQTSIFNVRSALANNDALMSSSAPGGAPGEDERCASCVAPCHTQPLRIPPYPYPQVLQVHNSRPLVDAGCSMPVGAHASVGACMLHAAHVELKA